MLDVEITRDEIHFGASMTVRFMRTLRIPADGQEHPLSVDLEPFPIFRVEDHIERVPKSWRACPSVFIPIHPHEAMWISFSARPWKPNAVRIAVGGVNALTGKPLGNHLTSDPQDYLVCPPQSALVGFSTADGLVRQFAAMPPRTEDPDEARSVSWRGLDSLRLTVLEPRPGRFRDRVVRKGRLTSRDCGGRGCEMTLTTRGQIRKQIQPDPYGTETWDLSNFGQVCVHMVNGAMFREIAGCEPPDCPLIRPQPV
ncbi:MAG: hypothetical protein JXQ75_06820 [Phycisphaerae bacterium]|nr:hypothetical protein [Phycisphaerae bacterium]